MVGHLGGAVTAMRKAIQLEVRLWIEGEGEPAEDWARSTTKVVRQIIAEGARATHPELVVKVRAIKELS